MNLFRKSMQYKIDAKGKGFGRVASEVAILLMGKDSTEFARNKVREVEVLVTNANDINISEKKALQTKYARYSGYPGGLRYETLGQLITKKGKKEVLRKVVYGMLPKNKLRAQMIKNLKFE